MWHRIDENKSVRLAEVAHIVAASVDGPRADESATEEVLTSIDNLAVLCPTCHAIVDGAPEHYPTELLRDWKSNHEARVLNALATPRYDDRRELAAVVRAILTENRLIWELYGPESIHAEGIVSDVSAVWSRQVLETIVPNNSRLIRLLTENDHLVGEAERKALARLRLHNDAMTERHVNGVVNHAAPRFPLELDDLFKED